MKALTKDSLREIRKKFKIFISILFMALLGVGFFAGIRATTPDMQETINNYFDNSNVMDINIMSRTGFTKEDVEKLKDIKEIDNIELNNSFDIIGKINTRELALKVITINDNVNKLVIEEGRLPESDTECVIDSNNTKVSIGDIVELKTDDYRIKNKELKVVGIASSPIYISKDRGTTSLASGIIDYFLYIDSNNVLGNIYTDMYLTLDNTYDLFSDEYKDIVDSTTKKIGKINSNWYIFNLDDNIGFSSYRDDTYRIENIAKIFPVIFFVVAILISLTSMTRMVEEQRGEIGTLKALGYSDIAISKKYILYASLATIIGGVSGIIIGVNLIPRIIFIMYQLMYNAGNLIVGYNLKYSLLGLLLAYICIIGAVIYACLKEMRNNPAVLMRPKAPKAGKRIMLEKIPFIWKKLNFTNKVTCRNMFRYKKRFLMTVIGIMGCTSLIFAGFGLKNSVGSILPLQYGKVFKYDMQLILSTAQNNKEIPALNNEDIDKYTLVKMESSTLSFNKKEEKDTQIMVVDNDINDYINIDPNGLKDGVYITKKVARVLNIKENDFVEITNSKGIKAKVKVEKITENYLRHYIYMNSNTYNNLFDEEPLLNVALVNTNELNKKEEQNLAKELLKSNYFSKVIITNDIANALDDTLDNMNYVVGVLIVSAGILALTVLYNLSNVNISERIRELATIKVLGFYDKEVYNYVSKENTALTIIGIILGLFGGYFLTIVIIKTCELNILMFPTKIDMWCYIVSVIVTVIFTIIVQIINYFNLKKIDMIESLKSVE